jgi:hypothetical protein
MIMSVLLQCAGYALAMVFGRAVSLAVYLSVWIPHNGFVKKALGGDPETLKIRLRASNSPFFDFITKDTMWLPLHLVMVGLLAGIPGEMWAKSPLRVLGCGHAVLLLGKAVLRLGHVDLSNFFFADRIGAVIMAVVSWYWPPALYLSVIWSCCLTYTIGNTDGLAQPYSNYLGFEYCRWITCFSIGCVAMIGGCEWVHLDTSTTALIRSTLATVPVAASGAYYFGQGAGKLRLGRSWLDWVCTNRIENLLMNAWDDMFHDALYFSFPNHSS